VIKYNNHIVVFVCSEVAFLHAHHVVVLGGHVFTHVLHVGPLLCGAPLSLLRGCLLHQPRVELAPEAGLVALMVRDEGRSLRIDVHLYFINL